MFNRIEKIIEDLPLLKNEPGPHKKDHTLLYASMGTLVTNYLILLLMTGEPNPIKMPQALEKHYRDYAEKQLFIEYTRNMNLFELVMQTGKKHPALADTNNDGKIALEEKIKCYELMGFNGTKIRQEGFPTPTITQLNQAVLLYEKKEIEDVNNIVLFLIFHPPQLIAF